MFIRKVTKKNKSSDKTYHYYRLTHSYKIGGKSRQQVLLNLGKLEDLEPEKHKMLADRIEQLVTGANSMFPVDDKKVEPLAHKFAKILIDNKVFPSKRKTLLEPDIKSSYIEVDIESAEELESKELGGEWLCKQALEKLSFDNICQDIGMEKPAITIAKALITARMVHPSSELEAERWLKESSSTMELYKKQPNDVTRYRLYKAATMLYANKDAIEKKLYQICSGLFSQRNKVVIFDLTNTYFEGMMQQSKKAKFARSKEKRNDCRLITLSLAIDSLGFVRHCKLWDGNVSEPGTLQEILKEVDVFFSDITEKPVVIFDAGIATEQNLRDIKDRYDYICVSRSMPKNYNKLNGNATQLEDNRGNKIKVDKVCDDSGEVLLHVESEQKAKKEAAIDTKLSERFEQRLLYLKQGLSMPRRLKKIVPVHEHIGRLKDQYSSIAKHYEISYTQDTAKGIITDLNWERKKSREKPKGHYFLKYSQKKLTEREIWEAYNLTREVEASFRCLKTDLQIRPIFHQKDAYIEPHIWLGVVAYQIVTYITNCLKSHGINYSWKTIVEMMKTQRMSTNTIGAKNNKKVYLKLCTRPNFNVKEIYDALHFKVRPFTRKTKVVTQM